jgi:hypothetical protein
MREQKPLQMPGHGGGGHGFGGRMGGGPMGRPFARMPARPAARAAAMRPIARPLARPMGRIGFRRMARRLMWGNYILFGVAGSALFWCFWPWQLAQIEAYYGMQAEMLTEAQILAAMQALNIQTAELTAEQRVKMEELDRQEAQTAPATKEGEFAAAPTSSGRQYCPNCGAPVNEPSAHFCERCGYEFH